MVVENKFFILRQDYILIFQTLLNFLGLKNVKQLVESNENMFENNHFFTINSKF
jgi:hypothetical protein